MASFNASVSEETRSRERVEETVGQCTPMQSPALGTLRLTVGNGTSVGTVMTLECPYKHRAVSGGRVSCVQDSNITQWSGGVPECKPLSRYEDHGFRVALLASIISSAIIIFMGIIFITSCLLKHVRKDESRRMERRRKKEDEAYWQNMDQQDMREAFYSHKGRNNNNNNSKPQQHTPHPMHQTVPNVQPLAFKDLQAASRHHQQDYPLSVHPSRPPLKAVPPITPTTIVLQPHSLPALPCRGYGPALQQPPWIQLIPTSVVTQDGAVSDVSRQGLKDPFWNSQHSLDPKSPPIWVISV
ncbi:uncharacterized protein susd3 [Salminus brasiliensis]|uniref:uncharacterized protein susd3 n=1 Tax=Salminus brasiliensis TaxID=930266 RepID=UPI003B833C8B